MPIVLKKNYKKKKKVQIVTGALRYFLSKYYKLLCIYFEEKKNLIIYVHFLFLIHKIDK